jgi:hypothetical protein
MPDTEEISDKLTATPLVLPNTTKDLPALTFPSGSALLAPIIKSSKPSPLGTVGFVINGESTDDESGFPVSSAGDINGDGLDDLIVGSIEAESRAGKSHVISYAHH